MLMRRTAALGAGLAALACAEPAFAQPAASDQPVAAAPSGTAVYDQGFFTRFAPNNAEDILRRIPGVSTILDTSARPRQERGFGSAGSQILLDGRRFPGKANEITATLRRIPATNVERVELITGATGEINVQSQGVVVNIILRPGASVGGSGSWELGVRFSESGWFDGDGLLSYAGAIGGLSYGLGVERQVVSGENLPGFRFSRRTRDEAYYYPDGTLQELRPQIWYRRIAKWIATPRLGYDFASGDRIALNGYFETRRTDEHDFTPLIRYARSGAETLRAGETHERSGPPPWIYEVSGEYAAGVAGGDFLGLFIHRRESLDTTDARERAEPTRTVEVARSDQLVERGEDIVRASFTRPIGGPTLEVGAEAARNTYKQDLDVFFDFNGDGRLEPATTPIANPEVEELRGELFSTVKWQPFAALSIDAGLNYEYSRLTTNYPLQPTKTLGFLKPRLDIRYKVTPRDQVRVLIERTVSQLNFSNFVPRYNVTDDRVEAGNPNLEPEKVQTFELGYEHRLADDGGRLELRGFYDDITDAIDPVPLRDGRGVLVSAQGNIPSATRYGLEAKASVRLGFIGLRDAQVSLRGLRQWSSIEDPFTGRDRRIGDDRSYAYDVGFRHDLTPWRMSYGFNYRDGGRATINSDLLVTEYYTIDPLLDAFVEHGVSRTLTVRLELQNLTHSPERRWRTLYAINAIDGGVRRVDFFEERRDIRGALKVRGRF